MKKLRRYQERGLANFIEWFPSEEKLATIILSTGMGKTFLASSCIANIHSYDKKPKVLWVAHREELIDQAYLEITSASPTSNVQIEMAAKKATPDADVVVGTVQTVARNRKNLLGFVPDLIVIDEYHHYHEKNVQYHSLLEKFPNAKILGLTATPYRFIGGDIPLGIKLIEVNIGTAIAHNYLVTPKAETLRTNISIANVKTRAGDFAIDELSKTINVDERNKLIANRLFKAVKEEGRKGILYAVDVAHSKAMSEELRSLGLSVGEVYGDTDKEERREIVRKMRLGEIDILSNNLTMTEGADFPIVDLICIARPTKSLGLYCLSEDTEILTTSGWQTCDTIKLDHEPYCLDIQTKKIVKSKILDYVHRELVEDEFFVELNSPTLKFKVTNKHNIIYRNKNNKFGSYLVSEAEKFLKRNSEYYLPISGIEDSIGLNLTDDELRFIGWFITDGTLNNVTNQIIITQDINQPYNKDIEDCLIGCGFKYSKVIKTRSTQFKKESTICIYTISKGLPRGTDKHLSGWGKLEKYIDKNFSNELENINQQQLSVLLEAIHLGDGSKQLRQNWIRRSYHIATGNKKFAENLQSLCVRRGYKCNIAIQHSTYMLHIKHTTERMIGGSLYKDRQTLNTSTDGDGHCWCIETEHGTLITRRNGFVSILGNCQMMGRGLRLYDSKVDCLVIDVFDKAKVTQGIASYQKVAASGDIDGGRRRSEAIMKEELADKLKNFPVVMKLGRGAAWTIDNDTWFAPAWMIESNQWVITWSKRQDRVKVDGFEWSAMTYPPKKTILQNKPLEVMHDLFGEGTAHDVIYSNDILISVHFNNGGAKNVPMHHLKSKNQKFEVKQLPTPIKRAIYVIANDNKSRCRVIAMQKEGNEFAIQTDAKCDETTVNEIIRALAEEDDMSNIVRANAQWRSRAASDKQKALIKNLVLWKKLNDDIDIDSLTGGDASALMDQVDWKPLINQLFGADNKEQLIGYLSDLDDV